MVHVLCIGVSTLPMKAHKASRKWKLLEEEYVLMEVEAVEESIQKRLFLGGIGFWQERRVYRVPEFKDGGRNGDEKMRYRFGPNGQID